MDFLGLTTLTVLDDAVHMIEQNRGVHVDLGTLPLDDEPTYKMFARGETTAIFQFESHGMRDILRRYQPTRLEDLTALNALYRPGPIQGGMIDDFIDRKHGKKRVTYDLPELKEILEETYGVILYQEQVMQIANCLAGFSLGEADILRRAMGKKNRDEMAAQREKFLAGCAVRKIPIKKAEKIFDLMAEFAGYGFNKSHSCAYAFLAYQTAYLKTHYPVEFMAALLTSETGNTEKVVKYITEARGMGITVLPPDVNSSDLDFTPVGEAIRFGLRAIKNVGENTVKGILEARDRTRALPFVLSVLRPRGHTPPEPARSRKPDQVRGHGFHRSPPGADLRSDRPRHGACPAAPARTNQRPAWTFRRNRRRCGPGGRTFAGLGRMARTRIARLGIFHGWFLHLRPSAVEIRCKTCGIGSH